MKLGYKISDSGCRFNLGIIPPIDRYGSQPRSRSMTIRKIPGFPLHPGLGMDWTLVCLATRQSFRLILTDQGSISILEYGMNDLSAAVEPAYHNIGASSASGKVSMDPLSQYKADWSRRLSCR